MRSLAVAVLAAAACTAVDLEPWRGQAVFVPAPVLGGADLSSAAAARAFLRRHRPLGNWLPGSDPALGYLAVLAHPPGSMQAGVTVTEIGEEKKRVVYADQIDTGPEARFLSGVLRPPRGSGWPRPCRTYLIDFGNLLGGLASGQIVVGGCARALEDLRGRVLFHLGRGGPPLYDFQGSLSAYRAALRSRRILSAPRRRPFFLGWKAAFPAPAGTTHVTARLREAATGELVEEQALAVEPGWDTLGGGWEIPVNAPWPRAGHRYRLTIRRGAEVLARGEVVLVRR